MRPSGIAASSVFIFAGSFIVEVLIGVATAPGSDADDGDAVRAELDARGAGEHPHPALGEAVRGVAGHRPVLVHRRDVDDPAAAALGDHLLRRELRAEERALEVDLEHLLVLRLGGVEHRGARLDAGVVHHDVEPAERLHRRVDECLQVGHLADVGVDADRLVAERDDLLLELLGGLLGRRCSR